MDTNTLQPALQAPDMEPAVEAAGPTDGQLLTAFVAQKDKAAFEALVHRHGAMIFGVCHRLLGNIEDAADAFQAVFLVFVRKAASIRRPEAVRAWLYNTAVRTSLKARAIRQRRTAREKEINAMPEPATPAPAAAARIVSEEDLALLDEELRALPEKYQLPVILCELEGRSRKEAAGILRLAEGTLSSRLATARHKLAARLQRRGVVVPLAGLGLLLAPSAASASMPATLTTATIEAATLYGTGHAATGLVSANAAAIAQGVLKGMLLAKLKVAAFAVLLVGVLTAGVQVGLAPEPDADFYYDFRGSKPVPETLEVFGDSAETMIKPEDEGLRITVPVDGGQTFGWGVATRFGLAGDFEVTATYELISVERPTRGGGAGVALNIAPDALRMRWAKVSRCLRVMEGSVHMAEYWNKDFAEGVFRFPQGRDRVAIGVVEMQPPQAQPPQPQQAQERQPRALQPEGQRPAVPTPIGVPIKPVEVVGPDGQPRLVFAALAKERFAPTVARNGQLRLARQGTLLRYLAAEEPGQEFREIHREEFGGDDVGLVRFVVNNNSSPTAADARLVDLRIRTARKAAAARAIAAPAANTAPLEFTPAARAPGNSPPRERTWWRLWALLSLAAALGGMLIVFCIARRRSAKAAAKSATATSAGSGPETFQCPSCQKRLKGSSADMNRKVRCPACQTTFTPAASQTPLAR